MRKKKFKELNDTESSIEEFQKDRLYFTFNSVRSLVNDISV